MGNCDHCAFLELFRDESLNLLLSDDVNISGCLIQQDHFIFPQDSSTDADQLLLAGREVATVLSDFKVESILWLRIFIIVLFTLLAFLATLFNFFFILRVRGILSV